MSAKDANAIAFVRCLVHRPKGRVCQCERCRSIRHVCTLATTNAKPPPPTKRRS